ncbi:hypothetical protein AB0D04_38705 [Streptomyces sp. NPDC048483]|uniref:hypothetical protein n=1 Tax=Streptomyces sp. NPDC048483 TaxID=3154927 RepID=UPI00341560A3
MRHDAPIVVHRLSATGGRRVTARGHILGLAYSNADTVSSQVHAVENPGGLSRRPSAS